MKRLIVAGLLALALTASSAQDASAWCRFNFSAGINISYESTGSNFCWTVNRCSNPPPACAYPACFPGYAAGYAGGYGGYPAYAYNYGNYGGAAPAAPAAAAAAPATQQVGYYFYGQGYAPSYWYGQ